MTQRRQKGERAPAPVRHLGDQPPAAPTPAVLPGDVGLGPGLVDQAARVKPVLILLPALAPARHVGAILIGGEQAFFHRDPLASSNRHIAP